MRLTTSAAFTTHARAISSMLPGAEIDEIGATAVSGALTKGDLDLLVRVPEASFRRARQTLSRHYSVNQPENWGTTFASFHDPATPESVPRGDGPVPVGVQLVVFDSRDDRVLTGMRDLLRRDRELLSRFNLLKVSFEGGDAEAYLSAKSGLIEDIITERLSE